MSSWILETQRLGFRRLTREDHRALVPILGDPETMYAWEYGFSPEQIDQWIDKNEAGAQPEGWGYHAAICKDTGELVGLMGVLREEIRGEAYTGLGYIVAKKHWGSGYATEGAWAWMDYAFGVLGARQVIADIRPQNSASRKVAERLGMQMVGEHVKHHNGQAMPHNIYSIAI